MSDSNKPSEQEEPPTRRTHWPFRLFIELPSALLVLSVALVIATILTSYGRTIISNVIIEAVPLPNGYQVKVTELTSPSIGRWDFKSLQITRHAETIVDINDGIIDWAPLKIIQGHMVISKLTASRVIWHTPIGIDVDNTSSTVEKEIQPNPLKNLDNPLENLDKAIEQGLKKFAIQLIPVSIAQIAIQSIEIQYKNIPFQIKISGNIDIGVLDNIIQTSMLVTINNPSLNQPLAFHLESSMNHDRDIFISLSSEFAHQLKDKNVIISSTLNTSIHLQEKPFRITLKPSRININEEIFTLRGNAQFNKSGINIQEFYIDGFNGSTRLKGSLQSNNLNLQGSISQLNPNRFLPETINLVTNSDFTVLGTLQNPIMNGSLTSSGTLQNESTHVASDFQVSMDAFEFKNTLVRFGDATAYASGQFKFKEKKLEISAEPENLHLSQIAKFNIPIPQPVNILIKKATTLISYTFPGENTRPIFQLDTDGFFSGDIFSIPSEIEGEFRINLDQLDIKSAKISLIDTQANATGSLNWRDNTIDLHFIADNVSPKTIQWLPISIPETIDSQLHADIRVTDQLTQPKISLQATGPLSYHQLKLNSNCKISTDLKQVFIEYCHLFDRLQPNSKNEPKKFMTHSGTIVLQPLNLKLKHEFFLFPVEKITQALPITLNLRNDLELEGKLQGIIHSTLSQPQAQPLQLERLKADIGFFGQAWSEPLYGGLRATTTRTNMGLELDIKSFGLDYGSETYATLKAKANEQKIDLTLDAFAKAVDFKKIPIENLDLLTQWPSQLRIKSHATGKLKTPKIEGAIEYLADIQQVNSLGDNITVPLKFIASFDKSETQPLKLAIQIYKKQQLQSEFNLETNWLTNFMASTLTHQSPEPLELSSQGQMNLENLNLLLSPVFHQFSGLAFWDWSWHQGNPLTTQLTGNLEINNGNYQHLTHGTQLQKAQIRMAFENNGIRVKEGSATDGASGIYRLKGFLDLNSLFQSTEFSQNSQTLQITQAKKQENETNLSLILNEVQLINRPDIESLAHGEVHLVSINNELTLEGKIRLQPLEIQLDRTQSDQIDEIDIIKFNPRFKSKTNVTKQQIPVNLKLDLHTNQQAYLRGKGINTELEGQVSIRGTASEPKIVGYFKTLRGDADILGKRFVINSGELRFEGYRGLLNIQATHSKANQDFIARVTGSLDNLDVNLESIPRLPEDETLSQLLFGKALNDISAIQALRIAAAVRSFSTNGSGLDPLATTRNLLGVDQVSIDSENTETGQENYKFGVGKYVSDKVYVEIQRSTNPTEPWQGQVQIELTPNISLDTSAESDGGFNGIDLTWKRDY